MSRPSFTDYYSQLKNELLESIWINESFKTAKQVFSQDNDPAEVENVLSQFKALAQQGKIKPEDKDITKWMRRPFNELKDLVDQSKEIKSGKEVRTSAKKDAITLGQFGDWIVIVPLTEPASCYYGKGTKWCTSARDDNYFNSYFSRGITLIYFINKKHNEKLAISASNNPEAPLECFDARDNSIFLADIAEETGIDKETIKDLVEKAKSHDELTSYRNKTVYKKFIDGYNELVPEAEAYLKNTRNIYDDPHGAFMLATKLSNLNQRGCAAALGEQKYRHFLTNKSNLDVAIDINRFARMIMDYYNSGYYTEYDYKKILEEITNKPSYKDYISDDIKNALMNNLKNFEKKKEKAP